MKNIIKFGFILLAMKSVNGFANVKELTSLTLSSGEEISPTVQIKKISNDSIQLFDGRIINQEEIQKVEVMNSNGSTESVKSGLFKLIHVDAARVMSGGDATGGG